MDQVYEFRVAGTIGPVIRSALPELHEEAFEQRSIVSGTANGSQDLDGLLRRLENLCDVDTEIRVRRVTTSTAP